MSRFTYPERLSILNLKSLEEERLKADLILTFRMLKGTIDLKFSDFFTAAPRQGSRVGHIHKLFIHQVNNVTTKFSFCHRVPPVWNSLPETVVSATSVATFKARLKEVDLSRHVRWALE
jgi:hypothetical protein